MIQSALSVFVHVLAFIVAVGLGCFVVWCLVLVGLKLTDWSDS